MALAVILFGLSALFTWAAAGQWLKLGKREAVGFPAAGFRQAAILTALALVLLGLSLAWAALLALNSI